MLEMIEQRAHVVGHHGRCDSRPDRRACSIGHGRDCRARSRGGRRASSVANQPGCTQFTSLVEAKPCTSTIGSPCALVEIGDLDGAMMKDRHAAKIETRQRASVQARDCASMRIARAPALLPAVEMPLASCARRRLLADETKPNRVRIAPSIQAARLNEATDSRIAPRPSVLRIARVLPPFFSASARDPRHLARAFGDLQPVERGLRAGLGLHPADVADEPHEAVGLLDLDRLARRAHRDRGLGDRRRRRACSADQSTTSRSERPIQSARRALKLPGLARRLDRRQPDPRRRRRADASRRCRR